MSHAKHPLIAAHRTDAATNLVGERLDSETIVSGSQRAGDSVACAVLILFAEKNFNRFLETALEQMFVSVEMNELFLLLG
jgi:hypothetical protein